MATVPTAHTLVADLEVPRAAKVVARQGGGSSSLGHVFHPNWSVWQEESYSDPVTARELGQGNMMP